MSANMVNEAQRLPRIALAAPPATVEFRGLFKVRLLLGLDGRKRVVPGEVAESMGADRNAANQRAKRAFARGACIMHAPTSSAGQDLLALDLKYLPAFLLGFQVQRVRAEVRPRLDEVKEDLYDALAAYTFQGIAVNPAFRSALPAPALTADDVRAIVREEHAAILDQLRAANERLVLANDNLLGKLREATAEGGRITKNDAVRLKKALDHYETLLEDARHVRDYTQPRIPMPTGAGRPFYDAALHRRVFMMDRQEHIYRYLCSKCDEHGVVVTSNQEIARA